MAKRRTRTIATLVGVLIIVALIYAFNVRQRLENQRRHALELRSNALQALESRGIRPLDWDLFARTQGDWQSGPQFTPELREQVGKEVTLLGFAEPIMRPRSPGDGHDHGDTEGDHEGHDHGDVEGDHEGHDHGDQEGEQDLQAFALPWPHGLKCASIMPLFPLAAVMDLISGHVHQEKYEHLGVFVLMPLPPECYWNEAPPVNQVVYIRLEPEVYTDVTPGVPMFVRGTLELIEEPGVRFFFMLKDANPKLD